ncbi:CDP-alcohol phosphatidyltransferase family protein [Desulfocastanea catecholica]
MKNRNQRADQQQALLRLRRQSCWAAVLLFFPWLSTIFLCRSLFSDQPATILALLPGLATAIYLHSRLSRHLTANHRPFETDRLFATLGAANWITLLRAAAVVALAGFLPVAVSMVVTSQQSLGQLNAGWLAWAPGIIYLGLSLADLLDGYLARRQGRETELGKRLDIETDAAGLLVASLLTVVLGRLPVIYLLVGLAYYPFIFGIWLRQRRELPVVTLQSRPFARIIAGLQMGLVGLALLPVFHRPFLLLAASLFMTPLLIGFLRDWLVVSCKIASDRNQQTGLDRWARSVMRTVPVTLRLVFFAGGVMLLVDFGLQWQLSWHLSWQSVALGIFCICALLAAIGCMGRVAALCLALLLAGNQSPFGTSLLSLLVFAAAAALMITGTGPLSLWTPEETMLYRRGKKKPATNGGPR